MNSENKSFHNNIILYLSIISSIIGAQRFTLPNIYAFACIIPFILSIYLFTKNRSLCITLIIFSIFLSVDNSLSYSGTTGSIRYIIYLFGLFLISNSLKVDRKKLFQINSFIIILSFISLVNHELVKVELLKRDILISLLIILVYTQAKSNFSQYKINFDFLNMLIVIFILAEFINIVFFYNLSKEAYLSFDSTKSLITLPFFYYFSKKNYIKLIILILFLLPVILNYGTRMIPITLILCLVLYLIFNLSLNRILLISVFIIGISFSAFFNYESLNHLNYFNQFKLIGTFLQSSEAINITGFLKILDPVRYFENKLFFDRGYFSILFGNGIGSGIYDVNNLLGFVFSEQSAFSKEELKNNIFYNFHDSWVDIGLRFGLSFIIFFIYRFSCVLRINNSMIRTNSFMIIMLSFCAFFSTSGLILISIFCLSLKEQSNKIVSIL